jgi:hypothetical protein
MSIASLEGAKKTVFFPFQGKNWATKVLIGMGIALANFIIPLVPLIPIYGYAMQIGKRIVQHNEDPALPDWNDWGLYFSDGIKLFGANILYTLPGILLLIIGYVLMFLGNFSFLFDPNFYMTAEASPSYFLFSMIGTFGGIFLIIFGILLVLAGSFLALPALGHLLARGEFGAAFRIREWWPVFKANWSGYLLALALFYGITIGLTWIPYILYFTIVLCILLPVALSAMMFLSNIIHVSLIAVTYRDGVNTLAGQE